MGAVKVQTAEKNITNNPHNSSPYELTSFEVKSCVFFNKSIINAFNFKPSFLAKPQVHNP